MPGQCDVDFSVFERRCEIVATHEACRCAGRVLERFDNLGDPRGRQHPGEPNLEAALVAGLGHGRGDLVLGGVGLGEDRDGARHRRVPAGLGHDRAQHPVLVGLQGAGDLVGLDLGEVLAVGDPVADLHQPLGDLAVGHRQAPLGHHHRPDPAHAPLLS